MRRILLSVVAVLLCAISVAQTQNNVWTMPPYYYNHANQTYQMLPQGTQNPGLDYDGSPALFCHNAMQDANGDLLFFIVDGIIYDHQGEWMVDIRHQVGANEVMIVPDPVDCRKYYIFGDRYGQLNYSALPYYFVLDLDNPWSFTPITVASVIPAGVIVNTFIKNWYCSYAATKVRADGSRFVYINTYATLYQFKIDASGLSFVSRYDHTNFSMAAEWSGSSFNRNEMELIETTDQFSNPVYRIAYSYAATADRNIVYTADLDINTGSVIPGTEEFQELFGTSSDEANVHGLEFSPNGQYLYITHEMSAMQPQALELFQVGSGNNGYTPFPVINEQDFQHSQIELGPDGKLYFAGNNTAGTNNRLATLSFPNTPGSAVWNQNAQAITYAPNKASFFGWNFNGMNLYVLPDQIDGMDYTEHFVATPACCLLNTNWEVAEEDNTHEYSGIQSWTNIPATNPFLSAGTVRVKDKLVIKSGSFINASNLTFEFGPGAQLIVEDGARLTLSNCTLTAHNSCDPNVMWHGVEVWGNGSFQPGTAGRFITQNNCLIEHAVEATANYRHNTSAGPAIFHNEVAGYNGGIIQLTNTKLHNNTYDANFLPYLSSIGLNVISDQSRFVDCIFETDNILNASSQFPIAHARLENVNGITFTGCDFINSATPGTFSPIGRGRGILSWDTRFTVTSRCTSISFPCPAANVDKSSFTNLTQGVIASSTNPLRTASITNTIFDDNWRSVYLKGLHVANVSDNEFNVGSDLVNPPISSGAAYGLYLNSCDGYKVENNNFYTTHNGYLGCYVNNSGTGANEIYRNTFTDFVVASQAANTNGDNIAFGGVGLEFRCNSYNTTSEYDILVSSGKVASVHGQCVNATSPANNQFSYNAQYGDFWMDNSIPSGITYQFSQPNSYNVVPRSYPTAATHYNQLNTFPSFCTTTFDPNASCPQRIGKTVVQLKAQIANLKGQIADNDLLIDDNNTVGLLNLINSNGSNGQKKNQLLNASPYLSDEVLTTYIISHPPNGHLKQVMLANSPLSPVVMEVLESAQVSNGTMNQIESAQTGVSPRQELEMESGYYRTEISRTENNIIRQLLFDESDGTTDGYADVVDYLENDAATVGNYQDQLLVSALVANRQYTEAQLELSNIHSNPENADFCKLNVAVMQLEQLPDNATALVADPTLQQPIGEVATSTTSRREVACAQVLEERVGLHDYDEIIEFVLPPGADNRALDWTDITSAQEEEGDIIAYPNPAGESFTIVHNLALDGELVQLVLFDVTGAEVFSTKINKQAQQIDVQSLNSGMYFYSIYAGDRVEKTAKLIIE